MFSKSKKELGTGRPAFLLHGYIDRRFMRKLEVTGELNKRFGRIE
jgi:hypothetical protein